MKVNNLLKRIGSVVTTAAMLATLGTTGFAADPVDVTGTKNDGSNIKITSVKRTDMGSGVYKFTIGYDSEDASKQNSIGVTMLTYVMSDRSGISAGTTYNDSTMQIVGVNQETQTNTTGNIEFSVATSEDSSALSSNALLMTSGQKGLVMIGGDNTTPAVAEFSIPVAAWTIASATVNPVSGASVSNIAYNTSVEDINKAVFAYIDNVTAGNGAKTATLTKKTGADKFDSITITKKGDANNTPYAQGSVGEFVVTIPLSNFVIPADSGATIGTGETDKKTVTVEISVAKDAWTASAANTTVGTNNTISVAEGADKAAIEAAIKASSIVLGDGSRQYTLSETEKNALTIEKVNDTTYRVAFAASYDGDTQIVTATGLTKDVTVTFTQNVASAVELVNGNTESATAYTWNKDNVSVKADAETDAAVSTAVKNKLGADSVYAKITYTNANTSGGAAQYEYVSASDFAYVADVEKDKVTATVTKEGISITSGNTFDFGYTVTPVLTALNLSATTYNYTKKADVEAEDTIKANITTELDKLTITEDGHTVNVADTEHTWTITLVTNGTYTAILKVTKFNDTTFDAWMPTVGYIEATVTGTISEKPAEAFTAKSFGAVDKEVSVGTAKADVISSLPTTATAYENANKTGTSATVNVENWTSSDYDASKIGEYTFTATVPVQTQEGVVKVTEAGTVSVKVTTKAITVDATKTVAVNVPVGYTAETVANALPAKLTYTNDTLTDTVDVTWTAIGAADLGKADGATFTVNGTVAEPSDNRLFNFDPKAVTATVTVRNSVESNKAWELGNTGEYNAGTVKVYLPTTAKKDDVVIATLYKADGTTLAGATATVTLTSDYNADTYNSVDLTFDKSFNAAGINANDKYTVKVTVAGTPLVYKDAENNDADSVQGTVYPTTSRRPSTGGGSTTPEVKFYNVSVKADNNGKATVNKSKATAGETVAVNVEPNEGYKVKEITVKDVNGKSIDVDQKTRTFEMPEGAVTVTVTFEEGTEEPTPDDKGKFKDVPDSFWAAADIYTLREAGIIDGKTADEFDPEGQVTRAEFTKMIVKMFGVEAKDTKVEFADCGEDDWFTPFVAAAIEAGYVKGYSDTEFAPDKVISREEACAILGRAYAKAANSELSFTDKDSIDEYAQPYVALLVEMGFINGYEDGTFRAQNHITRAEAAKIIGCAYRLATASK